MQIATVEKPPRIVSDWEFHFVTGNPMPITVNESLGDTVEFTTDTVIFRLVEQQSPIDQDITIPARDIFIPLRNTLCYSVSKRVVAELTPEQKELWRRNVEKLYGAKSPKPLQVR